MFYTLFFSKPDFGMLHCNINTFWSSVPFLQLLVMMMLLELFVLENLVFRIADIVPSSALNGFFKIDIFPDLFYALI